MDQSNSIIEFSDDFIKERLHEGTGNVIWSPKNYVDELFRRSQDRNTKALNRWTIVIAIATVLNTIAVIIQVLIITFGTR